MPVGLELQSLYLENEIANEANNGFIINLIESILIVIVIIMLVMGLRAGLLIGSSLIFSIGGTLLIMSFFGVGLNRTSLAGFIIAMGMLVDNAIVVTDNAQIAHCPWSQSTESIDRWRYRAAMGITRSHIYCHLLVPATLPRSFFRGGNCETSFRRTRHLTRIELGACPHADYRIR